MLEVRKRRKSEFTFERASIFPSGLEKPLLLFPSNSQGPRFYTKMHFFHARIPRGLSRQTLNDACFAYCPRRQSKIYLAGLVLCFSCSFRSFLVLGAVSIKMIRFAIALLASILFVCGIAEEIRSDYQNDGMWTDPYTDRGDLLPRPA